MIKMRSLPVNGERRFSGTDFFFFKALTGLIDLTLRFGCRQIRWVNSIYNDFFVYFARDRVSPPLSCATLYRARSDDLVLVFGD